MMWNPNLIPIFGFPFLMFLENRLKSRTFYLLSGIFWGLAFSIHYSTVIWLPIIIYVIIKELNLRKFRLLNWSVFLLGFLLANSPFILFELRHNFYNLRTILFHLKYYVSSEGYTFTLPYYFMFSLMPLAAYCLAMLFEIINNYSIKFFRLFLSIGIIFSIILFYISLTKYSNKPLYPQGWSISKQQKVIELIIADKEDEFEVAETINSDTRALDLRWWLRMKNIPVMKVENYDKAKVLYLIAPKSRPPKEETVWEVNSIRPFNIAIKKDLGGNIIYYKLEKTD